MNYDELHPDIRSKQIIHPGNVLLVSLEDKPVSCQQIGGAILARDDRELLDDDERLP